VYCLRVPFGICFLITVPVFYAKPRFFQNATLLDAGSVYPGLVKYRFITNIVILAIARITICSIIEIFTTDLLIAMRKKYKVNIKENPIKHDSSLKKRIEDFFYSDRPEATATQFLLMFLALGTIACGGAVLPGILKTIKAFSGDKNWQNQLSKKKLANALAHLKNKELIEIIADDNNKVKVVLTNSGQKRVREYSIDTLKIKKPEKWDGKWRILMFDIPSKPKIYNNARESLRNKIKDLGFFQVQKSAWAYPYECEDELLFVAEAFEVQKYIEILTVEKLLHEKTLKYKFRLF